ncbi:methyl-accepting chemotaxis protein [Bordetella genomosp. 8]|uniref:Methyl-accepting chemotaxis protein n=1 Tax=Bordetella genomosp. 8 TaxID=1416806 RepID=A0A1W6YP59_9BORD|nr:methyl-accepting chemotaxis protein [Bordetella genomosp. 8]ARP82709.1 methyl-accepting chemotaxis protein [Bordetella genomosp. 8]
MKNQSLKRRIYASFAAILAVMLLMVIVDYTRLLAVDRDAQGMDQDSLPGLRYAMDMRNTWRDAYDVLREGVSAQVEQTATAAVSKVRADVARTQGQLDADMRGYESTPFIGDDRAVYDDFKRALDAYRKIEDRILGSLQAGDAAGARDLLRGQLQQVFKEGLAVTDKMLAENRQRTDDAIDHILAALRHAEAIMLVGLLLAVIVAVAAGALLMRAINGPMQRIVSVLGAFGKGDLASRLDLGRRDEFGAIETGFNRMADELTDLVGKAQRSAIQVATSVTQIAATSKEQQATASEVAATTTEIGATSREIAATSRDLVRTMNEVSGAADQTASLADEGHHDLARMETTMRTVMDAAGSVNAKLAVLNEKAGNINQVVTTINKVADQTNLLSLNAAIEAEKAGEYGRGFAVVATEIRRLADQTAVATFDIEQIVREIQSSVAAGVMGMDKFSEEVRRGVNEMQQVGEQLAQIIQHVQTLAPRVQMVNEGMQAQATGAEQINQALSQLADATQQTVESLRQSSVAIDDLNTVAGELRGSVTRFRM